MTDTIKNDLVVSLAYVLTAEGEEIETATADDPVEYLHGAENIVPGLEAALTGRKVGDKFTVTLKPEDAYGEYLEDDVEEIERDDIPAGAAIEVGMEMILEDDDGNMFEATIKEIKSDTIVLDFNPPLAGKTITYNVEVVAIREADEDELEHGHVHGEEHYYDDFYEEEEYE